MKTNFIFLAFLVTYLNTANAYAERGLARIRALQPGSMLSGRAIITEDTNGLKIKVNVFDVPKGIHGIHIHEFGDCEGDGSAAGSHFNPEGAPHGMITKDGIHKAHAGDLGNIDASQDGSGSLEIVVPNLTLLFGLHSVAGRSVILHENADDFGQPVGNAGGRIGCGTITIVGE